MSSLRVTFSSVRVTFGVIAVALVLFMWGMWRETAVIAANTPVADEWPTAAVSEPIAFEPVAEERELREPVMDRYGNEVHRAVGDYRIDVRGDVYERHSPHTALPTLPPPGA